jgi:hypothetical protein
MTQSTKRTTTQSSVPGLVRSEVEERLRTVFADEDGWEWTLCIRNDTKLPSSVSEVQITLHGGALRFRVHASDGYRFAKPEEQLLQGIKDTQSSGKRLMESAKRLLECEHSSPVPDADRHIMNSLAVRCRQALGRRIPRLNLHMPKITEHGVMYDFQSHWIHSGCGLITNDESFAVLTDMAIDIEKDGFRVLASIPYCECGQCVDIPFEGPAYEPVVLRQYHATQEAASPSKRTKTV